MNPEEFLKAIDQIDLKAFNDVADRLFNSSYKVVAAALDINSDLSYNKSVVSISTQEPVMGVRGVYGFVSGGELKITYNHSDSMPAALGERVVDFCRHMNKEQLWQDLKTRLKGVALVQENDKVPEDVLQQRKYATLAKTLKKDGVDATWYNLLRPYMGGEMLWKISKGEVSHMVDMQAFPKTSLFCEYCYIIDLDNMTLDIFVGNQKSPSEGNPFGDKAETFGGTDYYPCKMVASFYLDKLPAGDKWVEPVNEAVKQLAKV